MATAWDKFRELIADDMRKVYSEAVVDHAINPRNLGSMTDADGFAKVTASCGDTMDIWISVKKDIIVGAAFITDGCSASIAAGSMVTELAKGKNVRQAQRIKRQNILEALGGLPEEKKHCALLAANTLKEAVKDYLSFGGDAGKRASKKY